jgi:hypothetical protein
MGKTHMGGLPEGPASQIILFGLLAWGIPHFETHPDGSEHGEYLKIAILQREDHIWSKNIGNILHIKPNPYGGFVKWRYLEIIQVMRPFLVLKPMVTTGDPPRHLQSWL